MSKLFPAVLTALVLTGAASAQQQAAPGGLAPEMFAARMLAEMEAGQKARRADLRLTCRHRLQHGRRAVDGLQRQVEALFGKVPFSHSHPIGQPGQGRGVRNGEGDCGLRPNDGGCADRCSGETTEGCLAETTAGHVSPNGHF